MKKGDIYSWYWTDDAMHNDSARYRSYHCKSRIAEFDGKSLFDTFWSSPTDQSYLDKRIVTLKLLGNKNDMTILHDNREYYCNKDLVVTSHSNYPDGPTYLKSGAGRDIDTMRQFITKKRADAQQKIRSAICDLERLAVAVEKLDNGKIDNLYI